MRYERKSSGVATYDVYVSEDGGAFTPWLTGTPQTSAIYAGSPGHRGENLSDE